ncbi:MAG TPA: ABC transporter substrate-binding protein [Baekduia sp.]|uniref:ABC transporter substrate-binding protein n=1 Tax=Baekduia sp. TaxID=2600305 RepID=UPI002D7911A1|nr:ABC transporter substrate-binding protein [Baekduia sp.]HET6509097.1 ABC transporter substrate-binding protein [Baekduia sp.]
MKKSAAWMLVALASSAAVTACGSTKGAAAPDTGHLTTTTAAAVADAGDVTWALNYEPQSIDPIHAYAESESAVGANLCEALIHVNPDLTTSPGLATPSRPDPTTFVYDLRSGVKFWDGHPLTADDVVYSLRRNIEADQGSYYADYFRRVKSIEKTGPMQVTIKLTEPDSLLWQVMGVLGAAVVEKDYAQKAGDRLGTAKGGLMCTGPYKLDGWQPGSSIRLVRNDAYWNASARAKNRSITFRFLSDPSAATNALVTGTVDGMYDPPASGLSRLQRSPGTLTLGENTYVHFLLPTESKSVLRDVDVRKALSMAIDRQAIAKTVYAGTAQPARTFVTPFSWGPNAQIRKLYEDGAWRQAGEPKVDLDGAKALVEKAGASGRSITIGFPTGGFEEQLMLAVADAAKRIGLDVKLHGIAPEAYANIYFDPKARKGLDAIFGPFSVDSPDPMAFYLTFLPEIQSVYNYPRYSNASASKLLRRAWETYEPVERARLSVEAEEKIMADLPFIPLVIPATNLYMKKGITGAVPTYAFMHSAWAAGVGASGQ